MLLDNDGDAVFVYTPPSLHSRSRTKAFDPRHAAKLFKKALADTSGRWEAFHFASHDNPHISAAALDDITADMTTLAYEQEILALDKDEAPGALWHHDLLDANRVERPPALARVVVGVDPPGGAAECGIVVAGLGVDRQGYVLADYSIEASPQVWAARVVGAYHDYQADRVVGEVNYGGDMVESTIRTAAGGEYVSFKAVRASRGKAVRAEPVAALYERGLVHHVGPFHHLEDELCNWEPFSSAASPNRLDALVWALSELMLGGRAPGLGEQPSAPSKWAGWSDEASEGSRWRW
jgi:phage terminase large subunit-like protein